MRLLTAFTGFCLMLLMSSTHSLNAQCSPDTDAPTIAGIPADITQTADAGTCGTNVTWTMPTASDNCEVASFSADAAPGELFAVGITTVTYTASDDAGNLTAGSFKITITDDEDPVISGMPANITISNDAGNCSAVATWTDPTAEDNCGIASLTSTYDSGDSFAVGLTTVTYTATDVNGNSVTANFTVTVSDTENPSINGTPADITQTADAGACSAAVTWTPPTTSDNCTATLTSSHNPGDTFNVGTTTVTYTSTDAASNTATSSFTVTVTDDESPVIAQMGGMADTNDAGNCSAVVTWADPAVTDNCANSTLTPDIASGSTFNVGVTTVTYTATDVNGNQSTMSFNVTVTDTEDPVINDMPTNITQAADPGVCTAAVTWVAPSATDNCTLATLAPTHAIGSTFDLGTTNVTYTAIDIYGNTTTATFTITVTSGDSDGDGLCDSADNCSETNACNYADPGNTACITPSGCETCSDATGTGIIVDNDADNDGTCDTTDGCPNDPAKTAPGLCGCGNVDTDSDSDGLCDASDNCTNTSACNYADATNGACQFTDECGVCGGTGIAPGACDCAGNTTDALGVCGGTCAADADSDGICDDVDNCTLTTACNYNDPNNVSCQSFDACGDCGGPGIPAGDCDCNGNQLDALGTCGGSCAADSDADGICDDSDNCTDQTACNYNDISNGACQTVDVCGDCGGSGIPASDCDCNGNQEDAIGVCGGTCAADADSDGVCDDVDPCVGTLDACGICNGPGAIYACGCSDTPAGDCDCNGNQVDALGICGGSCAADADGDDLCDDVDNCTDTNACNYDDPANGACTTVDVCGDCGGSGIPAGDCDCNGNQEDAIGVCGGSCAADADSDGVCDDVDSCVGTLDACNVCNGPGAIYDCGCSDIPAGDCDCNGNQTDALGVCGGTCAADADSDGICDDADPCVGTLDACGICNGPGAIYACGCSDIPAGDCDCNGNQADAIGVCGGSCAADADSDGICDDVDPCVGTPDACGICNGPGAIYDCGCSGIPAGDCDCNGNQADALGVCGGSCAADADSDGVCDDVDDCVGTYDVCGICNGPGAVYDCGCANIPAGDCDCNGNQTDALGVCGGPCAADADSDGICDDSDNCTNTSACNYDDSGNDSCLFQDECGVCGGSGIAPGACDCAGNVNDALGVCGGPCAADADGDGICDDADNCTDNNACNYADASNAACITTSGCETCTNNDGTGGVDANDDDSDGTCNNADGCPNDPAKTAPGICGCGNVDTDVDSDGVCDDNDLCTDPLANNYQSPGGEECAPCPNAPIFNAVSVVDAATTMSSADGQISLDITGGTATQLIMTGINGAPDYDVALPADLNNFEAGYYTVSVMDADGCMGVAQTSTGGTTLQQPGIFLQLIIPFDLCCSGCGVNDSDADGICDDSDNCTDQTACNFADDCNETCVYPDGNGDCLGYGNCGSGGDLRLISPQGDVYDFDPVTSTFSDPGVSIPGGVTEFIEYNGGYLLSYGGGAGGGIQATDSDMTSTGPVNMPNPWGVYNGIASMNGTLITVNFLGELASIDPTTGNWSNIGFTVGGMKGGVEYNAGADLVYAITSGGSPSSLLHIDPATGSVTNSMPVSPATVLGSLRYSGGILYAGGENGGLYTLNPSTGVLTSVGTMPGGAMISGIANKQN